MSAGNFCDDRKNAPNLHSVYWKSVMFLTDKNISELQNWALVFFELQSVEVYLNI